MNDPDARRAPISTARRHLRRLTLALALLLVVAPSLLVPAYAEDPGELTLSKSVQGFTDGQEVEPGDTFVYTITITCTNIGSGGCTSAVLEDVLPEGISVDGDAGSISVIPDAGTPTVDGGTVTVTFTQPLSDPAGGQGIQAGSTIDIQIPVLVDDDISPALDGEDLTNTATVDATNSDPAEDSFTVVPNVPTVLTASTDKAFDPSSATADPGTPTTLTLTGGNASDVPVSEITLTDPTSPPGAFEFLSLTGDLDVTLPPGAEQVQVDVWVLGEWINGPPGATAQLPAGVDPADVQGVRIHVISTDGDAIPPGASGSVDIGLEQRDTIADAGEGPIVNEVSTNVTATTGTSDAATADADYIITSAELPLQATKSFDPNPVVVGAQSTVTLAVTNTSDQTLDSLSVTEPGADPNMFTDGLTFDGWADGVRWPQGATGATVTYTYADGSTQTLVAEAPDTLPDPPQGQQVIGFTVEFTGPIAPGAEATMPFTVTAAEEQAADEVDHPNQISAASTAPGGFSGEATAEDTLTTIVERLAVEVDKTITPDELFSIPGQEAVVQLSGTVQPFPASTTDANQIVVQDPADLSDDGWYDAFAPTAVVETPVPDGATLTVQYWDGTGWVDVPGMVDLAGPQIFTGDLPADVQQDAQGIRFVYESEQGFPPGTTVSPNLGFELRPGMTGRDLEIPDCAASSATAPGVEDATAAQEPPDCPVIDLVPSVPANSDFIDKAWDSPKLVGERSGEERGLRIAWSTSGATNFDQMYITDAADPSVAALPSSVFDSFDLVRIDPITPALDPLLTYDQVYQVLLYSAAADAWVPAPDDPCPAACDGTFPGYTLSAEQQADTLAFRLVFAESPTRADRIAGNPTAPTVGSGVARSSGNDRVIHPVFRIRDELRSDPDVPVVADAEYNVAGATGVVRDVASADVVVNRFIEVTQRAADDIVITPVPVTADITKEWAGGPLGVPEPGTATFPDEYPTGRATVDAHNTTPRKVDRLTITEPTGGTDPFDTFNLRGFVSLTDPAAIGATDVTVTLTRATGGPLVLSRDEALAASESDLADVTGFTIVYTGRINAGAHAVVVLDTRLRPTLRESGAPVEAPATVDNEASTLVEDLVGYPGVEPESQGDSDDASIALQPQGIDLEVTKSIDPDEQVEPDRAPVAVTLTGQPAGPSRTTWMQLVDEDPTFVNQYDFVGFGPTPLTLTAPIDRVQVDAFTGGTFGVVGGTVVRSGGAWVDGTPGTTLTLPPGVSNADVQGLRLTFTRADGAIWENPATPLQAVVFQVQRRETLRTGGPVLTDLAGNAPAPGEDDPGEGSDTVTGVNRAADTVGGQPLSATDDASATILYRHSRNAVEVTKSPTGAQPPGQDIPYTLTFTNTGDTSITNPVIADQLPSDGDGPLLVPDPDLAPGASPYTYALSGAAPVPPTGSPMPVDGGRVTVDEKPDLLTFTFPEGTVLEVGQTYTITVALQFRPGLPGNTEVTNTAGITGDRPWDACEQTLDDETGACEAQTTVYPTRAGALLGQKTVRAVDDALGVLNTLGVVGCEPDLDGFYRGGCVPVTKPGGDEIWRMSFTNTGNLPQDRVYAVDRLPVPGDTGAITSTARGSQWRPIPSALRYTGTTRGEVSELRLYYDTDQDLCTDDLELGESCDPGEWTLSAAVPNPAVGTQLTVPADATAIKIEADFFDRMFAPTGVLTFEVVTTTPAQSPTAGPDTIGWNTVAAAARTDDAGTLGLSPRSEGNKVGVALATGPLEITKVVAGPSAEWAPDTFQLTVRCTSVGEDVDLGDDATVTLGAGEVARIDDLPWGSECTVSEDESAAGNPDFAATTVTVVREDQQVPVVVATNTYPDASLTIAKVADTSAVDETGAPITYGPFSFLVTCTYLGAPVYAAGYGPDTPMTATFSSGESVTFAELPAGAECTATETDTAGAGSTTSEGSTGSGTVTGDASIDLTLTPDGADGTVTNTVTFDNRFPTAQVTVTKEFAGDGAELYGVGPFTVHLRCVRPDGDGGPVYDGDLVLGGDRPLTVIVADLYAGAICTVTETATGGATTVTVDPDGPFSVDADDPVFVTVTNTFDVAPVRIVKRLAGGGASGVGDDVTFTVQLTCTHEVDGATVPVDLPDDGVQTLSKGSGLVAEYDDLPLGATCSAAETNTGGADATAVSPDSLVVGTDTDAEFEVVNTFDPPPTDPDLPATGAQSVGPLLAVAAALVLAGSLAIRFSRRRRDQFPAASA